MTRARRTALGLGVLIVLAALAGGGYWLAAPDSPIRPDFTLDDLSGQPRSIGEFDGDVVVLNFWASWCAPCRKEIPMLVAAQDRWAQAGLQVVGVAIDKRAAAARFARRYDIDYPVLADAVKGARVQDRYTRPGTPAGVLPYTAIIGRDGRVIAAHAGALSRAQLAKMVEPALAAPPPEG